MPRYLSSVRATAVAVVAVSGLLLSPAAEAAKCGGKNQRPCTIFERIPSCDRGLLEDFLKGRCVVKDVPGRDCGRANQRPCKVWERIPSCNANLKEDFGRGICVAGSNLRLTFSFVDRGTVKKHDAMSLQRYAGDIVVFEWLRDY